MYDKYVPGAIRFTACTLSWERVQAVSLGMLAEVVGVRVFMCVRVSVQHSPKLISLLPLHRACISSWAQIASRWAETAKEGRLFAKVVVLGKGFLQGPVCVRENKGRRGWRATHMAFPLPSGCTEQYPATEVPTFPVCFGRVENGSRGGFWVGLCFYYHQGAAICW